MTVLSKAERKNLDKTIQKARLTAELGAKHALDSLDIEQERKPSHLSPEQGELRRKLRARLRRLGEFKDLVHAVAYEQWHRMLFSRFLAENNLLIHPEYKVPISISDCTDLAREKQEDIWELAAEFASGMLPGIFQQNDPLLEVKYAPEDKNALRTILKSIPTETFWAEDALGWTYQFWQTETKKKVKKSKVRVEGYDICPETQRFTDHYMVQFLLQNTLGAWWLSLHPESPLKDEWIYYRSETQHDFISWPVKPSELKILDPSCGSGHFLVEAFHMLFKMRLEISETKRDAIYSILKDNIHGLELDPRCVQIAAFALALESWKSGFPIDDELPIPNLVCVGLPIRAKEEEWLKLAANEGILEQALTKYYDLFKNSDSFGSLIQLSEDSTFLSNDTLMEKLMCAFKKEKDVGDPVADIFGDTASGVLNAVKYLNRNDFHLVITNPPFLGYKKQGLLLKHFCDCEYGDSKHDLSTCFLNRCKSFTKKEGIYALVCPQNWLFLDSYKKIRSYWLRQQKWLIIASLGPHAFETITGEVVQVVLLVVHNQIPSEESSINGIDAYKLKTPSEKAFALLNDKSIVKNQLDQLKNPDSRIVLEAMGQGTLLSQYAISMRGIVSGDRDKWIRKFWEIPTMGNRWKFHQSTVKSTQFYSGREHIIDWSTSGKDMLRPGKKNESFGKKGVAVSQMRNLPCTIYTGDKYDNNVAAIVPKNISHLLALWAFCSSPEFNKSVRNIDQALKVTNATLLEVPFDLEYWQKVADDIGPIPKPYSDDPTQWLFKGNIKNSEQPLHVAIARLLGYRWPEQPEPDELDYFADKDGIVCIPSVRGEGLAVVRLRNLMHATYGNEWSLQKEEELLRRAGYTKSTYLEGFLRDEFFKSHCSLFHNRPFIWHIWDGRKDGFSVFVNYHKLDKNGLEKLIYSYLGDWINQQKIGIEKEIAGAEMRRAAAQELKKKLESILKGENPYDVYVRWKSLDKQPIGWEPDLDDGVRLNIRPFITAGVLRSPLTINWDIDRGKDSVPNCSGTVERHNDLHLSLNEKRKARGLEK